MAENKEISDEVQIAEINAAKDIVVAMIQSGNLLKTGSMNPYLEIANVFKAVHSNVILRSNQTAFAEPEK